MSVFFTCLYVPARTHCKIDNARLQSCYYIHYEVCSRPISNTVTMKLQNSSNTALHYITVTFLSCGNALSVCELSCLK
jgi:hypothetical protein